MKFTHSVCLAFSAFGLITSAHAQSTDIDFNRDVRPILSDKCYYCHGPDIENNKADLRLDLRASAIEAGAIDLEDPSSSELIQRILATDPDDIMPPPDAHKPLSKAEKEILTQWVNNGAPYDLHWSYKRVEKPGIDSIDQIIQEGLKQHRLDLSEEAPRQTLLRRVYLDTLGLPPTPEQAEAFLNDNSSEAYENLVNQLLASPHFGENMATDWLDAVRYTDSVGYHGDQPRDASPFRDYVIHAFNSNKPYDEFVTEQVAGDLLPNATIEQRVASSFNRLNQISQEGGIQDEEYIKKYQAERIRTNTTALLGSTLACAECHDHKFDPFTAKDFYSFGAFFADILEKGAWNGDGRYQEKDYHKYLKAPELYEKAGLGPTLRVPNRTFLTDIDRYEAERTRRLDALHTGTIASNQEFDTWLAAKMQLHQQSVPISYLIENTSNNFSQTSLPADFDTQHAYRFAFDVFSKQTEKRNLTGFGILLTYEDSERLFYWGHGEGIKQAKPGRTLTRISHLPEPDAWKEFAISIDQLGKLKTQKPQSITLVSSNDKDGASTNEFRNLRLETTRHQTPIKLLEQDSKDILERTLAGNVSDNDIHTLRTRYLATHANSPEQIELRKSFLAMNAYLNGNRETPATISAQPREIRVLPRGNWMDKSGEVVLPATPQFLEFSIASSKDKRLTRLDLAEWIVHRDNPLTARTYVNRIWAQFFGTPLSSAPEDLGLQGEYPIYPELLDYLAYEFMDSDWDIKHLVKTILMSEAYRQSSQSTPELDELDPYNRLLARQSPRRLKAENIRDNALAVSDLLVRRIGGASAKPYQPAGYYQHLNFPRRKYESSRDENQYRRGLYTHWQRTFLHPMLIAFDAPSRDECAVARPTSNTPLQALNQLNDPSFIEAAIALAHGLVVDHPGDDASRVDYAYKVVLTRSPSESERNILLEFLARERARFTETPKDANALIASAQFSPASELQKTELAAWASLSRALLNLHETITRY